MDCANCGAKIGVSGFSHFVFLALGTWLPVAGAIVGATMAARVIGNSMLIGGTVGLVVTGAVFVILYVRGAKLIVT